MTFVWYVIAAFAEIAGCFSFWAWIRLERSPLWVVPGMVSLALFAWVLTRADTALKAAGLRGLWQHLHCQLDGLGVADGGA